LTPQPHRGQRNEPAYVRLVVEKVAELQVKSFEEVAKISAQNATRLFQW
jgi:TatD DNase family protein